MSDTPLLFPSANADDVVKLAPRPATWRDDLIVEAGGIEWMVRGAQLVDGQPRFDWVEERDRAGVVKVDKLYVETGRHFEISGLGRGKVPMLVSLRRAINEAIVKKLRPEGAA